MTSPADAECGCLPGCERDALGFAVDPRIRLAEIRRDWNVDDVGARMDIADNDIDWLIERVEQLEQLEAELERLRQREAALLDSLARATWLLETAADQIDEWFPNDTTPEVQADLRRFAAAWQQQFGLINASAILAQNKLTDA